MLALLVAASPARAEPCAPAVHRGELTEDWERAALAVDHELATRPDIERCVDIEIEVRVAGAPATVVVVIGDRRATRSVAEPADLRATLLALVLAPIPSPTAPPIDDGVVAPIVIRVIRPRTIARTETPVPSRIDAGVALGALWIDRDARPAAALRIRGTHGTWSLGLAGRLTAPPSSRGSQPTSSDAMPPRVYELLSREVGIEIGRRFDRGWVALTASGGPSLVVLEQRQLAGDPASRSSSLVRMGAQLRAETVSSRRLGLFVVVDASWDAGHLGVTGDAMTGAPALPTWSTGIALGGEVRAWP